jgi:type I restriction enzyme, S subunit
MAKPLVRKEEGWPKRRLSDLGSFSRGRGILKADLVPDGIPVVRYGEIYTHHGDVLNRFYSFVSPQSAKKSVRLKRGDVLFARPGETAEEIGKATAFVTNDEAYAGDDVLVFSPRGVDSRFISYVMNHHPDVVRERQRLAQGEMIVHTSTSSLGQIEIPVPPSAEQKAIAEPLADADALVAELDELIVKKRVMARGAAQQLLTGKKRLAGFSGRWVPTRIGDVAECVTGGTPSTLISTYWNGPIRWMTSGELHHKLIREVDGRISETGLINSAARILPEQCVLIGLAGQGRTRGTVAINLVALSTNQSIGAILPSPSFRPDYLYHNLDSRYAELRSLSSGDGGRGGLSLELIRSVVVPRPSIEEQSAISEILSQMHAEIVSWHELREKTRSVKDGMLQSLLTGRVRLREPARTPSSSPVSGEVRAG